MSSVAAFGTQASLNNAPEDEEEEEEDEGVPDILTSSTQTFGSPGQREGDCYRCTAIPGDILERCNPSEASRTGRGAVQCALTSWYLGGKLVDVNCSDSYPGCIVVDQECYVPDGNGGWVPCPNDNP